MKKLLFDRAIYIYVKLRPLLMCTVYSVVESVAVAQYEQYPGFLVRGFVVL